MRRILVKQVITRTDENVATAENILGAMKNISAYYPAPPCETSLFQVGATFVLLKAHEMELLHDQRFANDISHGVKQTSS